MNVRECFALLVYVFTALSILPEPSSGALQKAGARRCGRIRIPNGLFLIKHKGRIAKITCNTGYRLIGERIAVCQNTKWDSIPSCVKDIKCPSILPKVLNGQMVLYEVVFFKVECNPGYVVSIGTRPIYPCEEFYDPTIPTPICQLTEENFCDFEDSMCGWNNTISRFPWIRHQNATPSHRLYTGPAGDHTFGLGTGYYMYIETSGRSYEEENYAKIVKHFSKIDTPEVCFVFWYHMYGMNIGTLDVYVDQNKVFSKSGDLGDKWRKGIIQKLPSDNDFVISVIATTGNGYAGDIAIDDIGLVNSTDCTKILLVETSCENRCFEQEPNATLCKCSPECLVESTCCSDFMKYCSADASSSTLFSETSTDWTTEIESTASNNDMMSTVDQTFETLGIESTWMPEIFVTESAFRTTSKETRESTTDVLLEISQIEHSTTNRNDDNPIEMHTENYQTPMLEFDLITERHNAFVNTKKYQHTIPYDILEESPTVSYTPYNVENHITTDSYEYPPFEFFTAAIDTTPDSKTKLVTSLTTKIQFHDISEPHPTTGSSTHGTTQLKITTEPAKLKSTTAPVLSKTVTPAIQTTHTTLTPTKLPKSTVKWPELRTTTTNVTTSTSKPKPYHTTLTPLLTTNVKIYQTTTLPKKTMPTLTPTKYSTSPPPKKTTSQPLTTHLSTVSSTKLTTLQSSIIDHNEYEDYDIPHATEEDISIRTIATSGIPTPTIFKPIYNRPGISQKPFKWKKTYTPKGRYTFSAVKSESQTTTYVSIIVSTMAFVVAVIVVGYFVFKRRRLNRHHDVTEETDVLYMTSDEVIDFNVACPQRQNDSFVRLSGINQPSTSSQQTTQLWKSDFH